MSAAALIPSLIPMVVVVAMRRAEARIHRQLADAQAFSAESAISLSIGRSMDRRRLQGLIDGGAVQATTNNRHFLDAGGWEDYMRRRSRRVALALTIVLALVGVALVVVLSLA